MPPVSGTQPPSAAPPTPPPVTYGPGHYAPGQQPVGPQRREAMPAGLIVITVLECIGILWILLPLLIRGFIGFAPGSDTVAPGFRLNVIGVIWALAAAIMVVGFLKRYAAARIIAIVRYAIVIGCLLIIVAVLSKSIKDVLVGNACTMDKLGVMLAGCVMAMAILYAVALWYMTTTPVKEYLSK